MEPSVRLAGCVASALIGWCATSSALAQSEGVLIRLDKAKNLEVRMAQPAELPGAAPGSLYLWSDRGAEKVASLPTSNLSGASRAVSLEQLSGATRGGGNASSAGTVAMSRPLAQLLGGSVIRGEGFVTPTDGGVHLHGRIAVRRLGKEKGDAFPATVILLEQGPKKLHEFPMAQGVESVRWDAIPNLPANLKNGLAAGEYTVRDKNEPARNSAFKVLSEEQRAGALEHSDPLKQRLAADEAELHTVMVLQDLFNHTPPLLADALDLLEDSPDTKTSAYLAGQRDALLARLKRQRVEEKGGAEVGIAQIDAARRLLAQCRWQEARDALAAEALQATPRGRALAKLYRAVILAESGPTSEAEATQLFMEAMEELAQGSKADQFRAANAFGVFCAARVQDRLYNHAFQAASGVESPLVHSLVTWQTARESYVQAMEASKDLSVEDRAAIAINLARLYVLLSDIVLTLQPAADGVADPSALQQAAAKQALAFAEKVLSDPKSPLDTRAEAHSIKAHLAFRQADWKAVTDSATQAQFAYLRTGSLAGVEATYRMRGMSLIEQSRKAKDNKPLLQSALRELQVSNALAEALRNRIPADELGSSRTGFFARRAYVNEQLVELHVALNQPLDALRYAELAKARALQDVLLTRLRGADLESVNHEIPSIDELLANWPDDLVALEYYLGAERGWVFVIASKGHVSAYPLLDATGQTISSRLLVQQVRGFLNEVEGQSKKMLRRLMGRKGLDHTWQDDLHRFYDVLIPQAARADLAKSKTVVVSPHHILHYFPFAALVTAPDRKPRERNEMVQPTFLLDASFDLVYTPSLTVWGLQQQQPAARARQAWAMGIVEVPGAAPLPGVEKDLENFKAAFGAGVRGVQQADRAKESAAAKLLEQSGVVLFATHGLNDPDSPLDSYLLLLPEGEEGSDEAAAADRDGHFSAREVYLAEVRSDLVVMSACYSGLGDRSPLPGDDLFGMQRSLLQAGARTVVSGLWDVYDDTAPTLMAGFFERLAKGEPAAAALAGTQRSFLKTLRSSGKPEPYVHPYFWAVYTVAGDHRTTFQAAK